MQEKLENLFIGDMDGTLICSEQWLECGKKKRNHFGKQHSKFYLRFMTIHSNKKGYCSVS